MRGTADLHFHHVVPRSKGGRRTVALCGTCHGKVHDSGLTRIQELTTAALAAKKARGERTGSVPWGMQLASDGTTLELCQEEQRVIARARELRAEGQTQRAIVAALDAEGARSRAGGRLTLSQVQRMLS
jgi:hypothetical protein